MSKSIYKLEELGENLPWDGKKVTLVGGCYDLLHYGHVQFLENAKKESEILVVALESDEFIRTRKKREPVHTQEQRAHILASLRSVDYVILLPLLVNDSDYASLVTTVKPSVIAVTENDPNIKVKNGHAQTVGATVKVVTPLLKAFSSTQIITYENILSG